MSPAPTHPSGDGPSVIRTEVDDLTTRLGELAGHIHAATAELVGLLGRLDEIGGWCDPGIRSLGHWASIYLGIDVHTATEHAKVGRQLAELPAIAAAAAAGELGWSKLRLLGKVAEPDTDQKWLDIARDLSVSQLGRVVGAYRNARDQDNPDRQRHQQERRGLWLFNQPDGLVRIFGLLEPDDAAVLRAALEAHGELLWRQDNDNHGSDNGDQGSHGHSTEDHRRHGDSHDATPSGTGGNSDRTHGDTTDRDGYRGADTPATSREDAGMAGSDVPETGASHPEDAAANGDDSEATAGTAGDNPSTAGDTADGDDTADTGDDGADASDTGDDGERGEPARSSEVDPTLAARDPAASRRVDALVSLARAALAAGDVPDDGDDLTEVLLLVDHDVLTHGCEVGRCSLNDGPPIGTETARRLACDARLRALVHRDGQPLNLGRSQRTANRSQRRALRFRDGPGCAFPGCQARHVDAHHLQWWENGGPTDIDNLCLLCRRHHRLMHEGRHWVRLVDGHPRFYRPDGTWIRPPNPPPTNRPRGSTELRRRHYAAGQTITARTPEARDGGAGWQSPAAILDGLFG
jgi:hypothetical protein